MHNIFRRQPQPPQTTSKTFTTISRLLSEGQYDELVTQFENGTIKLSGLQPYEYVTATELMSSHGDKMSVGTLLRMFMYFDEHKGDDN